MAEFYLTFEKTGWNPHEDRIMAISFHELEKETGGPVGELKILSEWTSSEPAIISEFLQILDLENPWNFVPICFDLRSDLRFLRIRALKLLGMSLSLEFLYETLPVIDLLPVAVLMNKGRFKGTNLAWLLGYTETARVSQWFRSKDYDRLISYIHAKKDRFLEFYRYLRQEMPLIWAQHTPLHCNTKLTR
ncbi:MAG: hypothetical protein ACXADX_12210 [Candidatus Hodarchaeales archaeon]